MGEEVFDAAVVGLVFARFSQGHDAQARDGDAKRIVRAGHADDNFVSMRDRSRTPGAVGILVGFEECDALGNRLADGTGVDGLGLGCWRDA
jgi:hypothetical protein